MGHVSFVDVIGANYIYVTILGPRFVLVRHESIVGARDINFCEINICTLITW